MHSQLNILPPNAMQPNITVAIDLTFDDHFVVSTDMVTNSLSISFVEAVLAVDALTRQITDKRLSDTITTNIWFTEKNAPQSDPWS